MVRIIQKERDNQKWRAKLKVVLLRLIILHNIPVKKYINLCVY